MSNYYHQHNHSYTQIDNDGGLEDMDYCHHEEEGAIEGLLKLQLQSSSRISLVPSHIMLNPIQSQPPQDQENCTLPSLSNLLLPQNTQLDYYPYQQHQGWHSNSSSSANLLYSPGDDNYSIYSQAPPPPQHKQLIPPLSTSTSYSSLRSFASSSSNSLAVGKGNLLSRAATLATRRRGRPRKSTLVSNNSEFKIVDMSSSYGITPYDESTASSPSAASTTSNNKPRWQEAERLELLEAIVKEKNLDDMTTIRWDRISLAVGRAKKACKDQWRRELLPNLMRGLRSGSSNSNKKKPGVNQ